MAKTLPTDTLEPIVLVGRNVWRIEKAQKASLIVDAADYYAVAKSLMACAQKRIFLAGWDFDTRIPLSPDAHGEGEPVGEFMLRIAKESPDLQIDILAWNFGALKQFIRPRALHWLWEWWGQDNIDMRLDSSHPFGCSHHQKILVIDNNIAACGGIDISTHRWDTRDHDDDNSQRVNPGGEPYQPWHDATMLMKGDVGGALADLSEERWRNCTKEELEPIDPIEDDWPEDVEPMFENVDIAIARTRAAYDDVEEIHEIEALWIAMICKAKDFIYIENQYFTSAKFAAAIAERMQEAEPPEIVMVMPKTADGWLEQQAMDGARATLIEKIGEKDARNRFRVYMSVTKDKAPIYVHAKVAVMDDRLLRVGSANLNNRSARLDSECDVIIDSALPANKGTRDQMTAIRHDLLAEHLGVSVEAFAKAEKRHQSMIKAIEELRGSGKTLELLPLDDYNEAQKYVANNQLMDPEDPDGFLDPQSGGTLQRNWRRGFEWARRIRRRRR